MSPITTYVEYCANCDVPTSSRYSSSGTCIHCGKRKCTYITVRDSAILKQYNEALNDRRCPVCSGSITSKEHANECKKCGRMYMAYVGSLRVFSRNGAKYVGSYGAAF